VATHNIDQELLDASIELAPFSLIFENIQETPQPSDYEEALAVTREGLHAFLFYLLDDSLEFFALNSFTWGMTTEGPRIDFIANIKFIDSATDLVDSDIMDQIHKGFTGDSFRDHYIKHLQLLDPSNPFHQTKSIQFHSTYDKPHTMEVKVHLNESNKAKNLMLLGFAGAAALLGISCLVSQHVIRGHRIVPSNVSKKVVASNENSNAETISFPLSWMPRYWQHEDDTASEEEDDEVERKLSVTASMWRPS
jgi:hypothetical protein